MFILWVKSALLSACSASRTNAPMAVPLRSTCLDNTNSFFSPCRYLANFTTRSAKAKDFCLTTFSFIPTHSPFSIFHSQLTSLQGCQPHAAFCGETILLQPALGLVGNRVGHPLVGHQPAYKLIQMT